jgi:hypothetical protein
MRPENGHVRRSRGPPRPDRGAERELSAALRVFSRHVGSLAESTRKVAVLRWKQLQVRGIEAGFAVAFGVLALFAGVALAVAAALRFVAGVDHALARWSGEPWVGELGAGVLGLAALAAAVRLGRGRARRAVLAGAPRPDADAAAAPPES